MKIHGLAIAEVAALARVSPSSVSAWLRPESNAAHRVMPDAAIELLWIKVEGVSPFNDPASRIGRRA